ncbi:hypothetical protein EOD42_19360 [Rhodovarius crocodyli]|uniref:OmpA-like domain-containing protein n=1 Tax=Rhodovarius crocodyli TaxID=1979269 RepID=A0A437M2H5_9PROT|nr:hypothetical protein [Rhodovarius crocodyli]RVT91901.1 hypothetical protein EOD42_19360 [Rhodovarius crocodyli]
MRRRALLLALTGLVPLPGLAQEQNPDRQQRRPQRRPANRPAAAAPPPPPALPTTPAPPPAPPAPPPRPALPPIPLPAGFFALPGGGWRMQMPPQADSIPQGYRTALAALARRLSETTQGRVSILAQVTDTGQENSFLRRLALARGLSAKEIMLGGGLAATRIDVRPLGMRSPPLDAVDIYPPGVPAPR